MTEIFEYSENINATLVICVKIEERKLAKNDIIDFVLHYVEHHYNEDLSLDSVASKINLSSG
jgi:YesN/AraC family two-component response regulator